MGNVRYNPDDRGFREIAQSAGMTAASVRAAGAVERFARSDNPHGDYSVSPATVTAGWRNEHRNGARVTEEEMAAGARKRTLARAAQAARG